MGALSTIAKAKWWLLPHKCYLKSPLSPLTKALARAQKPRICDLKRHKKRLKARAQLVSSPILNEPQNKP